MLKGNLSLQNLFLSELFPSLWALQTILCQEGLLWPRAWASPSQHKGPSFRDTIHKIHRSHLLTLSHTHNRAGSGISSCLPDLCTVNNPATTLLWHHLPLAASELSLLPLPLMNVYVGDISLIDQIFINKWRRETEPRGFCLQQPYCWFELLSGMGFVLPQRPDNVCIQEITNLFQCSWYRVEGEKLLWLWVNHCAALPVLICAAAASPEHYHHWNSHV